MITLTAAQTYSINNGTEVAYEVEYSEGTKVRAVVSAGGWIRKEAFQCGAWVACGKPYVVQHNAKRQAERLVETVKKFLAQ